VRPDQQPESKWAATCDWVIHEANGSTTARTQHYRRLVAAAIAIGSLAIAGWRALLASLSVPTTVLVFVALGTNCNIAFGS
jgi:hypothetical protein